MAHSMILRAPTTTDSVIHQIVALLQRIIGQRCGTPLPVEEEFPELVPLELALNPTMSPEGYSLSDGASGSLLVTGGTPRGLLYGVGRLLREANYAPDCFTPGAWRGSSSPVMPVRGIYFATHFHNWYHDAPVEEIVRYVEELALWGYNIISVWFDQHHFASLADPAAQEMIVRLKAILNAAKRIGLMTSLTNLANEAYATSPLEMRADWTGGHNGYFQTTGGHYHVEICPSKPGGTELILREFEEKMQAFQDVGVDYIWLWPYDQGGCTCGECAPWGANGFLRLAEPEARLYKHYYPAGKVILSTWYFDRFTDGEWVGLDRAFTMRPDWCDYLLVDDYGDIFPPYPLQHGVPGDLPMVSFPEISMYNCAPWGGYGANPLPAHLQALWQPLGHALSGGFPYSEGIYEDLNKAICAQYFWDPDQPTNQTVRQYLAYEFGTMLVTPLSQAVTILEHNLARNWPQESEGWQVKLAHTQGAADAWQTVHNLNSLLTPERQQCWRWRILYLRAQIDTELVINDGLRTPACESAFKELTRIYHAQQALSWVAPPTKEALAARRG
ncbi:MAG: beta-N-acetylhexosaminidase family protein [Anaerolineae bacterium]